MANSKLTLSIEPEYIEMAKNYALENNTSVSKLFKDFIRNISKKESETNSVLEKFKDTPIHPDILALTGVLKGKYPDNINLWDVKYEYLKKKYNL
jgi:hypothetical protein